MDIGFIRLADDWAQDAHLVPRRWFVLFVEIEHHVRRTGQELMSLIGVPVWVEVLTRWDARHRVTLPSLREPFVEDDGRVNPAVAHAQDVEATAVIAAAHAEVEEEDPREQDYDGPELYTGRHRRKELINDPEWRTRWASYDTAQWPTLAAYEAVTTAEQLLMQRPVICHVRDDANPHALPVIGYSRANGPNDADHSRGVGPKREDDPLATTLDAAWDALSRRDDELDTSRTPVIASHRRVRDAAPLVSAWQWAAHHLRPLASRRGRLPSRHGSTLDDDTRRLPLRRGVPTFSRGVARPHVDDARETTRTIRIAG